MDFVALHQLIMGDLAGLIVAGLIANVAWFLIGLGIGLSGGAALQAWVDKMENESRG